MNDNELRQLVIWCFSLFTIGAIVSLIALGIYALTYWL